MSERSLSANLRVDGQKSYIRPNPWVSKHNIAKPGQRKWEMVNTAIVQRKIMLLPGEICHPWPLRKEARYRVDDGLVNMAEVSREREAVNFDSERFEGSVIGLCS